MRRAVHPEGDGAAGAFGSAGAEDAGVLCGAEADALVADPVDAGPPPDATEAGHPAPEEQVAGPRLTVEALSP